MTRRLTFLTISGHEFPVVGQCSPVRPTAAPAPSPRAGAAPTSQPVAAMTAGREHDCGGRPGGGDSRVGSRFKSVAPPPPRREDVTSTRVGKRSER